MSAVLFKKSPKGFSLIELMLVLTIAVILMTVAVPSFISFTQNSEITSGVNDLTLAINLARSEASKRGMRVVLCRTADPTVATPSCGGNTKDWSKGWLIYAASDLTGRNPVIYDTSKGDVLIVVGEGRSGLTIKSGGAADRTLEYNPDGSTAENGNTAHFALCDKRGVDHGKHIEVKPIGRPVLSDATTCTPS